MKSFVFEAPLTAKIIEQNIPEYTENQVLVKMIRVGVCGTDMQVFAGKNKFMTFPVIPFHEGIGEVANIGKNVTSVKVGDVVTIRPIIACGNCRSCKSGAHNACEQFNCLGVQSDGLGSEYFAIDESYVNVIPKDLSIDESILIEPFAVGIHASNRGNVKNKNVIVIGGGTIGNFTAQAAKLIGAKKVAICDISEEKINFAKNDNIDFAINTQDKDVCEAINEAFGDEGADVIIDCVGINTILNQILQAACKVSTVVIVANYSQSATIDITKIQRNELNVLGSITYTRDEFKLAVKFISEEKVYMKGFITERNSIYDIQKGMEKALNSKGLSMKNVFDF